MILLLLYASLLTCILQTLSLNITVPTQPHPLVNDNTSVLLTWSPDDPSHFFLTVERILPADHNIVSTPKPVENFYATRNETLVFESAGNTSIEAIKISPTEVGNVTFATSEPFQVDEGPTGDTPASYTPDPDISPSSATVSSTVRSSLTTTASASPSTKPSSSREKAAIIAGVVCGTFLLASIITVLLIWRYRKRRSRAPSRAFLNELDDKRHPKTARNNRLLNDPPPAYSPRISRAASKLFRWTRRDDDSVPAKMP
ncbi:hypothetical protein F5146DRAFT_1070247 [Armillaria mellea]|nr:hypothetical protein F5146DRAFT_1070247 [Armillaria mellea]